MGFWLFLIPVLINIDRNHNDHNTSNPHRQMNQVDAHKVCNNVVPYYKSTKYI